jgi:hypothetical protein
MRPLSGADLLNIWERGIGKTPVERALVMLDAAFPQAPPGLLAKLNVAQRDRYLLHLRALTFGPLFKGLIDCPLCHQRLELEFDTQHLPVSLSTLPDPESMDLLRTETAFHMDQYEVHFRLPNSIDLAFLSEVIDGSAARQRLLEACIVSVKQEEKSISVSELPAEVLDQVVQEMDQADPVTDLTLPTSCPNCGQTSEIVFDIVTFFWGEIQSLSARLIREVHTLASAYGWREADILAMSPWRRKQYLELMSL